MIHNLSLAMDLTAHITNQAIKLKERWKYEPLIFATPSSTKDLNVVSVEVYPNPAYDILNVSIKGMKTDGDAIATIMNMDGKVMAEIGINKEITDIQISELPSGVYTIKVMHQNKVIFVSKFIKIQ